MTWYPRIPEVEVPLWGDDPYSVDMVSMWDVATNDSGNPAIVAMVRSWPPRLHLKLAAHFKRWRRR